MCKLFVRLLLLLTMQIGWVVSIKAGEVIPLTDISRHTVYRTIPLQIGAGEEKCCCTLECTLFFLCFWTVSVIVAGVSVGGIFAFFLNLGRIFPPDSDPTESTNDSGVKMGVDPNKVPASIDWVVRKKSRVDGSYFGQIQRSGFGNKETLEHIKRSVFYSEFPNTHDLLCLDTDVTLIESCLDSLLQDIYKNKNAIASFENILRSMRWFRSKKPFLLPENWSAWFMDTGEAGAEYCLINRLVTSCP